MANIDDDYGDLAEAGLMATEDGDLLVEDFAVPGLMKDKYGNKWTIPIDEMDTEDLVTDPMQVPVPLGPEWYGQYERKDRANQRLADGFVPVRREEVGAQAVVESADYGHALTPYHEVGDSVYMKIPKVLIDRRRRAQDRLSRAAVDSITDPRVRPEALGGANRLRAEGEGTERHAAEGRRVAARSPEPTEAEAVRQQFMPRFEKHKS